MNPRAAALVVLSLALYSGCRTATVKPDLGVVENAVYRNDFFGLSLPIPPGVEVADRKEIDLEVYKAGKEALGDQAHEAMKAMSILVTLYMPRSGVGADDSAVVMLLAQAKVSESPTEYLRQIPLLFAASKKLVARGAPYKVTLWGLSFDAQRYEQVGSNESVFFAAKHRGYLLAAMSAFVGEPAQERALALLKTGALKR